MIEEIRTKVQSLYETKELLGFSVQDDHGVTVHNESFLSDEAASAAITVFINCRGEMLKSSRKVQRFIVEMDDVILVYALTEAGHTLFTLDRNCDLDAAAKLLIPSA